MERRIFLEVLYDGLPDKSRILMNKSVKSVQEDEDGVEVFCHDGTSERGDIVLGCDGVHSKVRQTMWENAAKLEPTLITASEKKSEPIFQKRASAAADDRLSYDHYMELSCRHGAGRTGLGS